MRKEPPLTGSMCPQHCTTLGAVLHHEAATPPVIASSRLLAVCLLLKLQLMSWSTPVLLPA